MTFAAADWEVPFRAYCAQAGLSAVQTEMALCAAEGYPLGYIKTKFGMGQRAARIELEKVNARLARVIPDFRRPAQSFPQALTHCAGNRAVTEERPDNLRGVEGSTLGVATRFQGAAVIPATDERLLPDAAHTISLWVQHNRPVAYADPTQAMI